MNYNESAGKYGEYKVQKVLGKMKAIKVWNDITILGCQIDHIVLYWTGLWFKVLCIETKNWSGLIQGKCYEEYWVVDNGGKVTKRYNPIQQNKKHKSMLKLLFWWCPVVSIVVMVAKCVYPRFEYWQCSCYILDFDEFKNYVGVS